MGGNMLRKHVKVEPELFYWLCDSMGVLVWQDMPSGDCDQAGQPEQNGHGGVTACPCASAGRPRAGQPAAPRAQAGAAGRGRPRQAHRRAGARRDGARGHGRRLALLRRRPAAQRAPHHADRCPGAARGARRRDLDPEFLSTPEGRAAPSRSPFPRGPKVHPGHAA